jgi:phosphoribosylformylglycinamidine cyclo-ligase
MMNADNQYATGVDTRKGAAGAAITAVDPAEFPHAFCRMYRDPEFGFIYAKKPDGVGSKSVQRYLHAVETGDQSVYEGDADDCIAMNMGDVACGGLFRAWAFTDMVDINQLYVDKKAYLKALNRGFERIKRLYAEHGIPFRITSGETADLVHQTETVILGGDIYARGDEKDVITGDLISQGDVILGIGSGGPCKFEARPNSGMMSNGSTFARLVLMHPRYAELHPEIAEPRGDPYSGRFSIGDVPDGLDMEVSEALMSPTRHFPVIAYGLVKKFGKNIHGLVFNTGGGQTKIIRVGDGIQYVKHELPRPDPFFILLQAESERSPKLRKTWKGMFEALNCGVGMDVVVPPWMREVVARYVQEEFGVGCQTIGHCEASRDGKNHLHISSEFGKFDWDEE